jgi:hypothetical protein
MNSKVQITLLAIVSAYDYGLPLCTQIFEDMLI